MGISLLRQQIHEILSCVGERNVAELRENHDSVLLLRHGRRFGHGSVLCEKIPHHRLPRDVFIENPPPFRCFREYGFVCRRKCGERRFRRIDPASRRCQASVRGEGSVIPPSVGILHDAPSRSGRADMTELVASHISSECRAVRLGVYNQMVLRGNCPGVRGGSAQRHHRDGRNHCESCFHCIYALMLQPFVYIRHCHDI